MRRVKYSYHEWECYRSGLYNLDGDGSLLDATTLLGNPIELLTAMRLAVQEWPKSAAHRLTDDGMNQRAWLGWAAVGLTRAVPAHITRAAWWQLSESERVKANAAADTVIAEYHDAYADATLF